jgi:KaiC/GvpD/RAD55 family RecA-like ATPase
MQQRWAEFLHGSTVEHGVQVYGDAAELATSVAAFLAAGLDAGQPGVVVATPTQTEAFARGLAARGWDVDDAEGRGLLLTADAEETLAALMDGDTPSPALFDSVVGGLLDRAEANAEGREPRVFGEMVDLLVRQDRVDAAFELEELWNDLARRRRFSLLCGYQLDVFDPHAQAAMLPRLCNLHSHVLPANNDARLAGAVDRALDEVLGSTAASQVYRSVARERDDIRVPMAQLIMMWLSTNMPAHADRVLDVAREHYGAQPGAQPAAA